MFDIGFWEITLIGIVTLLVVGPDRLPEVARTAGRWVLKIRRFVAGVKSDFNRELQTGDLHKILGDQKQQINELRSMVDSTRRELESSTSEAVSAAKSKIESLEDLGRNVTSAKPASASAAVASVAAQTSAAAENAEPKAQTQAPETQASEKQAGVTIPTQSKPAAQAQSPAATDSPAEDGEQGTGTASKSTDT